MRWLALNGRVHRGENVLEPAPTLLLHLVIEYYSKDKLKG